MEDADLAALLDEARLAEAAGGRRRARVLRQAAEEAATLAGALRDLGEAGAPVVLATRAGRIHRGVVAAVGLDVVVLGGSPPVLVALPALRWVRPGSPALPTGDRDPSVGVTLHGLLSRLDQPELSVGLAGGELVNGTLLAVGADVLTIRRPGGALVYLPTSALEDVVLDG